MTTSRHAWKQSLPESDPRWYVFTLNHALVIAISIPLLVATACHRGVMDSVAAFGKAVTPGNLDAGNAPTSSDNPSTVGFNDSIYAGH